MPATSLAARLLNVFATPGDVFEEVKAALPSVANWLVPIVIYGLVTAVSSVLVLSQPAMAQKIHEKQEKVFDDQVKAGKITQEQADQMEKYAELAAKIAGGVGGFFMGFITVFGWAFLLWLIGRFALKANLHFMKVTEVAGLAASISALESLVRMLLIFGFNNPLASPSMAMLLKNPDHRSRFIEELHLRGVSSVFHYIPLHASPAGRKYGRTAGALPVTVEVSERLARLPLWIDLAPQEMSDVIAQVISLLTADA